MPGLCCWRRECHFDCIRIQEEVLAQLRESIVEELDTMKVSGVANSYMKRKYNFTRGSSNSGINMIQGIAHTLKEVQLTNEGCLLSNQFCYCYVISCVLMCDMRL